jgi:hypothetical protein
MKLKTIVQKQFRIQQLSSKALDYIKLKEIYNLTKEETQSLHKLKTEPNLIIKPADKGGATVLIDEEKYIKEALGQLNDTKYYKKT